MMEKVTDEQLKKMHELKKAAYHANLKYDQYMVSLALELDLPPGKFVDDKTGEIKDSPQR
jgi:hypothetical protein